MTDVAQRPPLASVALLSSAALATEILLSRSFAVVHWHHFAYMIISLALLGFGASGTFLALAHRRLLRHFAASYLGNVAAFAILVVASPVLAQALPFQAEALLWDPWQPLWLVLLYLVLSTPFFCAANAIGLALIAFRDCAGRVYAADLIGAGMGSVVLLGLLYLLWPEELLRIIAATGFVAMCLGALELRARPGVWVGAAVIGLAATIAIPTGLVRFEPGPYKGLSQALLVDGTRVTLERSSPLGRVSVIESPRVPLRSAPGLSLSSTSEPPDQLGVFTDGDDLQVITAASDDDERLAFLAETTSALAYRIAMPRTVFVPGAGGGMEILRARRLGAQLVDAVELNPQVAELLREEFGDYTGGLLKRPGVRLHVGDARGFLAANDRRYDLIQMSLTGASGGGGLGGLNEDYLHTVEAFRLLGEVVERARVGARTEQHQLLGRPLGTHLLPAIDAPLRGRFPHLAQVSDRHRIALDPVVFRVDDDRQRVERDRQLDVFDTRLAAGFHLFGRDRTRGIRHVRLAPAELLEAAARTRHADSHADLAALGNLELLGKRLGDREHGARAVDLDRGLGQRALRGSAGHDAGEQRRDENFLPQLHGLNPLQMNGR